MLFVVPKPNVGGLQTTLRNRIRALNAAGVRTEIIFQERGDGEYIFDGIPHRFIRYPSTFAKAVKTGKYDVISFVYSLRFFPFVPHDYKGIVLYEVRGWGRRVELELAGIARVPGSSRRLNAILCIARYLVPLVKRRVNRNIPVFVDGNAVDPMFHFIPPKQRTWKALPIPKPGRKVIAYVGRVEESKNWREFADICEKVSRTDPIESWVICHPNTSRDLPLLIQRCEHGRLKGVLRVIRHVPNHYMPQLYSIVKTSGGCVLTTSRREGLGNSVLEPMACGLPVVSSNVPGKNEIIRHEVNGLLYPLGNADAGARCVRRIIRNQKLRNRLITHGLRTIRTKYRPSDYARRFLKILARIKR